MLRAVSRLPPRSVLSRLSASTIYRRTAAAQVTQTRNLSTAAPQLISDIQSVPEAPFIVMFDLDYTLVLWKHHNTHHCDAYLPSSKGDNDLHAYLRSGTFEFFRRLAKQNVKFGFLTNRSGPYGHSIIDLIRYALAQKCPNYPSNVGPVHEYYTTMMKRVLKRDVDLQAAFKVPSVKACANCTCGVAAIPELDDQLERRVRYYRSETVCKTLANVFPDPDDWQRAILIDDDEAIVSNNLGHAINALDMSCGDEDFHGGRLHRILPIVERCVEVTREHRQQLGAKLQERRADALKQEQEELTKMINRHTKDEVKYSQRLHNSVLEAELIVIENKPKDEVFVKESKSCVRLPPRWSEYLQARIATREATNMYDIIKYDHALSKQHDCHDLWLNDPVCKVILTAEHGEEGYQQLLDQVKGKSFSEATRILQKLPARELTHSYPVKGPAVPGGRYEAQMEQDKSVFWFDKNA